MSKEILIYLIKSGIVMGILYALYHFVFKRETFHNLNRIILLSILIISSVIPLINFNSPESRSDNIIYKVQVVDDTIQNIADKLIHVEDPFIISSKKEIIWTQYIMVLYFMVIIILLFQSGRDLFKMLSFRKSYGSISEGKYRIINTPGIITAFSFFNVIFIDTTNLEESEIQRIIEHEKIHSKLYHTLDLLFVELFILFFWFNPFIYLIRSALKEVHEYQADSKIVGSLDDTIEYQKLLIKKVDLKSSLTFTSNFNSLTLKRIKMMTKSKSNRKKLYNITLLPLVIVILIFTLSSNKTRINSSEIFQQKDTCIVLDTTGQIEYEFQESTTYKINYKTGIIMSKPRLYITGDNKTYTADSMAITDGKRILYGDVRVVDNSDTLSNSRYNEIFADMSDSELRNTPSIFPVDRENITEGYITISYNKKKDIAIIKERFFETKSDSKVFSTADGIVISITDKTDDNDFIITIDHQNGFITSYEDLSEVMVVKGEIVKKGQDLGIVGKSSYKSVPHVIYGILKDGELANTDDYLPNWP